MTGENSSQRRYYSSFLVVFYTLKWMVKQSSLLINMHYSPMKYDLHFKGERINDELYDYYDTLNNDYA